MPPALLKISCSLGKGVMRYLRRFASPKRHLSCALQEHLDYKLSDMLTKQNKLSFHYLFTKIHIYDFNLRKHTIIRTRELRNKGKGAARYNVEK